ncbi:PAS domain-containing protein [Halobellus sp. GM3]|uniref:PAS domain-containing protein n=1 Tax=Halobellus sp. GM3 TaxID=3458410 RepID=UPI00403E28D1
MSRRSLTEALQETLLAFDRCGEPMATREVADRLDLGRRSTYERLTRLVERERLETKKVGANARVWWRPVDSSLSEAVGPSEQTGPSEAAGEGPLAAATRSTRQSLRAELFEAFVTAAEEYAVILLDRNGRVRSWNAGAERLLGYEDRSVLGEHVSTLYDDREADVTDRSTDAERRLIRSDGSRFWAAVRTSEIREADGDLIGYATVVRDLSARREQERQLRRERDLIDRILETAPVGLSIYEPDGSIDRINTRVREKLGIGDPDDLGRALKQRRLYDDEGNPLDASAYPVQRVIDSGESVSELVLQHDGPDGELLWVSITASPVFDDDGRLERVVVAGKDVTELKRSQRQLERQRDEIENELLRAYERGDEAFFALDDDWTVVHLNERASTVLDRSADDVVGQNFWESFPEIRGTTFQERYERALDTQESVTFEEYFAPMDRWFEVAAYPDENGLSVYFRDVTERKDRERQLEESRRRLRTIVDHFPNGAIALVDDDLRYVAFGGTTVDQEASAYDEFEGRHVREAVPSELADRVVTHYRNALDGEVSSFEATVGTRTYKFRTVPVRDRDGDDVLAAIGMSQDVTEQRIRQRELEQRISQQETVADLSQYALDHADIDTLLSDAAARVASTLETDYCRVLELDSSAETLRLREGVGWDEEVLERASVSPIEDGSQAAHTLRSAEPIVVTDFETERRFGRPDFLAAHDVRSGICTLIGPPDDPWGILCTHHTDAREFSDHDVNFVQSAAAILAAALGRHEDERALRRQREQLAALNNLNAVVQEITEAVINRPTREEIESTVCNYLAGSGSYRFAWISDVDVTTQTVDVRAEAGVEGILDDVVISVDPDDERSTGPISRAFRTGEMQVSHRSDGDLGAEPWHEWADGSDVWSAAAVPIVHEGTIYGVLNLYADRPDAFEGQQRSVIERLGEVVGHAIAATERKRALMSDEVVELDFRIRDVFGPLDGVEGTTGTIAFEHIVPLGDEEFLAYGTVTPDAVAGLRALSEAMPHGDGVVVRENGDEAKFELRLSEPPVLSAAASLGASVERAVIEDGDYCMTFHLSPSADVRRLIDAVRETYPTARLLKRQQISRALDAPDRGRPDATADLTDRQRTALEVAYHAGFFEWPRSATGEDVAEAMGISSPTFHQHLRKAERKVLESVLSPSIIPPGTTPA